MTRFRDLQIRQKLVVLIVITATTGLLFSGFGIIAADSLLFHSYLKRDLVTFAQVIADNSTASLAFDDQKSAQEVLAALRVRTHIVGACLVRTNGAVFADYVRPGMRQECPAASASDYIESTFFKSLMVVRPVELDGRRLGRLIIVSDLEEITDRGKLYGLTVLVVLIISSLLVILFSSNLVTLFVTPILKLAETTALVSQRKDYSLRAERLSNDEVGNLSVAFNEMLAGIESRDTDLRQTLAEREEAAQRLAELNVELRRSNEDLARLNQDLQRFAFIASHDMQEPLRNVTIFSQLLVDKCQIVDPESEMFRAHIVEGTSRMRELLADLLTYVEITTGPAQTRAVDLNAAIEKVKQNLRMSIDETGTVVCAAPLPRVDVHEAHLISLFQNLIGNSIKYRGPEAPRINISSEEADGFYQFAVADNGMGIEPEYHEQIFVAFKRLHGKDIPGTGIGLAICQRVVERYGGRIWVDSEAGRGATFKFTLPKLTASAANAGTLN